jgi:hypothetical protein
MGEGGTMALISSADVIRRCAVRLTGLASSPRSERPATVRPRSFMLRRLLSSLDAILNRAGRSERDVVARYEGQKWCDSSERGLNDELAMIRRRRH